MPLPAFIRAYEIPELTMSQALDVTHLVLDKLIEHFDEEHTDHPHQLAILEQAQRLVDKIQDETPKIPE